MRERVAIWTSILVMGAALAAGCGDDGAPFCGNGRVEAGEECDDGNSQNDDGCHNDCRMSTGCGNGVVEAVGGEFCDDGNNVDGDGCSADCSSTEECGNGVLDTAVGEACDDGNNVDGDGCPADCISGPECGNGVVDTGEVCDDGNNADGDGCSADCQSDETCGNNVVDTGEVCDDGNTADGDGCSADCQSDETCGNNVVDPGEACDDGNTVDGDGCSADCQSTEGCGNSVVDPGEVCDDGNNVDNDGCSANCQSDETCGNSIVDTAAGEQCDDGNTVDGDGCSAACQTECNASPLDVQDDGSGANGAVGLPDLVLSEIDPGSFIELWNTTAADITLSTVSHQLCSPFVYVPLSVLAPAVTVPANGYATVPWPPTFQDMDAGGEIQLYASGSFATSTEILDFVCWGTNPHGSRMNQATSVGKWSGACAPALTGGSLHRVPSTTGTTSASYDTTSAPSPTSCAP